DLRFLDGSDADARRVPDAGRSPAHVRPRRSQRLHLPGRLSCRKRLRNSGRPGLARVRRPGAQGRRRSCPRRGRPGADFLVQGEAAAAMTATAEPGVPGLTNPRGLGLERFPIRAREQSMTLSAWRLSAAAEEGDGPLPLVERRSGGIVRGGEGIFLGWPQERLGRDYAALVPQDDTPPPEMLQLGCPRPRVSVAGSRRFERLPLRVAEQGS